jgi:membrane-associated phospholipid phosphatase
VWVRAAREIALIFAVYVCYSLVRNFAEGSASRAEANADVIVRMEKTLYLFHEKTLQHLLDISWVIRPFNTFYALAHFFVTGGVMLWLFLRRQSYRRRRNALILTTLLALVGYASFPLMPPRLYPEDGVVDALLLYGAPWTYEGDSLGGLSNQYAAMPSLHVAWAMWCTWALWTEARRGWVRVVAAAYTAAAVVAVVVTGNHWVLDAVGGLVVLMIGIRLAGPMRRGSKAVVTAVDHDRVTRVPAARTAGEVDRDPAQVLGSAPAP